jgi:hypothetical protein
MRKFSAIIISVLLLNFFLPTKSYSADLIGPTVSQRSSTSSEDATNYGVLIDIYYQVEDESGVDEARVPDTFIRLPGNENDTSLRARPTLISGNTKNGSWLARFSYSKGIPPGIYVASTSTWYDTLNNGSAIPPNVTIRVDNLAITSTAGINIKPSDLICNPPQQINQEDENDQNLSASLYCTFTPKSLRNGYKINAFLEQGAPNSPSPNFTYINDQIIYPRVLSKQKIGKTFTLTNVSSGVYTLKIVVEFLDFPDITQTFRVNLSKNFPDKNSIPVAEKNESEKSDQNSKLYYEGIANSEISGWIEKINSNAILLSKSICFSVTKINLPPFTQDSKSNEGILNSFRSFIYGNLFSDTIEKIKSCPNTTSKTDLSSSPQVDTGFPAQVPAVKKFTITCIKGKTTKKVSGTNPKCPKGYKLKK